jgi:hypothetical protein
VGHTVLLLALLVSRVTDGLLTLHIVGTGLSWELNPLLQPVVAEQAGPFLGRKLLVCGLSDALLWFARRHRLAPLVTRRAVAVYGAVMAYELSQLLPTR